MAPEIFSSIEIAISVLYRTNLVNLNSGLGFIFNNM